MSINKVSQSVHNLLPEYFQESFPLFDKFLEYYYRSQEKTGLGQHILNDFLNILDIDKLNINILDGSTILVEDINAETNRITLENVDNFLEKDGTVLIDDEIIFYEKAISSPSIALSPGISYNSVKLKWINLFNIINLFDGQETEFDLKLQDAPVSPTSAKHLIVKNYGRVLVPNVDYTVEGSKIIFNVAPRAKTPSDDTNSTSITFLKGFNDSEILTLDNLSNSFSINRVTFSTTIQNVKYEPIVDEYVIAIYDGNLLVPKVDFTFDSNQITFNFLPLVGKRLDLFSIEAPIPNFGKDAVAFSRVSDSGLITNIVVSDYGSGYRFEYPPKVTIKSIEGSNASAKPYVDGIKSVSLLSGGLGYSDTNPPVVNIQPPTIEGGTLPVVRANVENGSITSLDVIDSGSGYTFTPRVSFVQPGGAEVAPVTISGGQIVGSITVTSSGSGYSTAPQVYVDAPTGSDGILAALRAIINDQGEVESIVVDNPGQGYESVPRVAIIDPVGAKVLSVTIDAEGRLTDIDLLSGGSGYEDVPSVYIVDDRVNDQGVFIGGTGATATAVIFNGQITDINVSNFGTGYNPQFPPKVIIQSPPPARAAATVGNGEITGFQIINSGSGYQKCRLEGCARAASSIINYSETGNAIFSGDTSASSHTEGSTVKCLDSVFVKRILDKYIDQYLPDVPKLDYTSIDVRNAIKNIKTFYSTKGTSFSIAYLFKLLYGETVNISYPRDQIIKPSSATWSVNTILRAVVISGDPQNIKDALIEQLEDIADPNIKYASALVENFLAIETSTVRLYEIVLSPQSIEGKFVVPYKTKLADGITSTTDIITVDSTIGWPERNGEFVINGSELVRYKEKSLNQFIECTRGINSTAQEWDAATEIESNFNIILNRGTSSEVVMNIVGIVDAQQTTLTDTGSYYLPGDKLSVSKLGGSSDLPQLTTWIYNVKKIVKASSVTFGGIEDRFATIETEVPHGLLVGDQVTVYGANPIIYNGTFLVTSRISATSFQYQLPQPATLDPQGNILISVDINKGKSTASNINGAISSYTTNIQNTFFNDNYVYVASTGIPNHNIGPFTGSALLPGNQRKLNRFPILSETISTKNNILPGPIASLINGVSVWSYKSPETKKYGFVKSIDVVDRGSNYDAGNKPVITISGGGGSGASAEVIVDGSIFSIDVLTRGSGYTSAPLVSIVGGGGSGASATAIITKGEVSSILINNKGSGYTSKPEINVVGGGGTGATASAVVRGPIKGIEVISGGSDYTSDPDVTLSSGEGAAAQAIINNGRIISVAVISGGNGYTTAPQVTIQGDGFGAIARAVIDIDGENAGKVTSVEILNRGIGYNQGTTLITLTSIGEGAKFDSNLSEWTFNLEESITFDDANGFLFTGLNSQYGGEYAHVSNPKRLRFILGDNLIDNGSAIVERNQQITHSPILGWAFDGNPIYGPYGYEDPTDQFSLLVRMRSSYALKSNLLFDSVVNPYPSRVSGPPLSDYVAGSFVEDYQYNFGSGDLDQYNGRFCKTPEFPEGRYCYFVTIDATENGNPVFPYILGPSYNSVVDDWNLKSSAIQQNIPTGVVRFRDPYENVDIDVDRAPNSSQNSLTTESGDLLLFEVEDENRDSLITQDEIDDPDEITEEPQLQIFDYFPKVRFDSKVDIEVETTTKFEDASLSGFIIENAGQNYQVNDILVFDDTGTSGSGASARISRIVGETISAYTYELKDDTNYGTITTENEHNLVPGDKIYVDYEPIMDNTNKQFVVRQYRGIEEIVITQDGYGYNADIPPEVIVEGDGVSGKVEAVINNIGNVTSFNILNSGNGYTNNPRLILTHPQIFKRADYFLSTISGNGSNVKVNDIYVTDTKQIYVCGSTLNSSGNTVGFVSKFSATGSQEWSRTLESTQPSGYTTNLQFKKLYVNDGVVWVVGQNSPNVPALTNYNPDVTVAKYTESADGLSATLSLQRAYSGISGALRSDNITCISPISDTRLAIGGYTNTNSSVPFDAFLAVIDTAGSFVHKRKLATDNKSEKITSIVTKNSEIYFTMEIAPSSSSSNVSVGFGKATVVTAGIIVDWIKENSNTAYAFLDTSLCVDEYDEFYITSTCSLKTSPTTTDSFWVGKFDDAGSLIWNYRYIGTSSSLRLANQSRIDIFGDLNLAYVGNDDSTKEKNSCSVKIKYNGEIITHTKNKFTSTTIGNNVEGLGVTALGVDVSGDAYLYGQSYWNRNEFVYDFATDATDLANHYTPVLIGNDATESLIIRNNRLEINGLDVASPSTWVNSAVKHSAADLEDKLSGDWTLEFMLYKPSSIQLSQTYSTLVGIGDALDPTGGLWLAYNTSNGKLTLKIANSSTTLDSAGGVVESTQTTMYANNSWQFIGLKKQGNTFTAFVNGIQVLTGTIANTSFADKDLWIGNQPGWGGSIGTFASTHQGHFYLDNLRLRNRSVTITVPTDVTSLPPTQTFALSYTWTNAAWFTTNISQYDYIEYNAVGLKTDKNSDNVRLGNIGLLDNTDISLEREAIENTTSSALTISTVGFSLGQVGLQTLDFAENATLHSQNTVTITHFNDLWSFRNSTIPAPGSQKVRATAIVKDRYFFKVTDTIKIDNIQQLTLNQSFRFKIGAKLVLKSTAGSFINSGYIVDTDTENNYVYVAVNNNNWSNDTNTGRLSTERFDEQETYGIRGPEVADTNVFEYYEFAEVVNTTPGTFDIDLANYDTPLPVGGTANLDEYATFQPFSSDAVYQVRILETSGVSPYIPGSVIEVTGSNLSFNAAYSTLQITGLTAVTKITLTTNLEKILQVSNVSNSDRVYVITDTTHYLSPGEMLYVTGNPSQSVGGQIYDEYDGSFAVETVISQKEFTYKLPQNALTIPSTNPSEVDIFVKSPILKMYYGHQYLFDMSHSSLAGGNLSFSKDSLNKLEYSFNSIERIGIPGVYGPGQPLPSVKLKVDREFVTNISYYFDPSRPDSEDSPIQFGAFLNIGFSPYEGVFTIINTSGGTITTGDNAMTFVLPSEPEGDAIASQSKYSTDSEKAVGPISDIRIVSSGGFYTKLPVVTGIQSNRKIERVQIIEPGTEYAVGAYNSVPILGDGEGGLVTIRVNDTTDDEGNTIPGQITEVVVTSPGKGYTTAFIDVESIDGILGPGLAGSGAELSVIIPPFGSGASLFTKGKNVGKIKKLKNNNFGYDYTHDYTLRPEITFPVNAQLVNTSILESITVTDPGSGYTQAPAVIIEGGGGSGAIAEATIRNGRLDQIIVKDPGAGYSSEPNITLKSSFNYIINLDLGLLQFSFPHGIASGSPVTLNVVDTGDGAEFPIAAGAIGRLNGSTTYYAIAGAEQSLEDDQLKLALTPENAELGDALTFVNSGVGRQQILTSSFGGDARANVITSTFLEGELVYQGQTIDVATATGYVSTNDGWQVGPRILKLVNTTGDFVVGERITGVISKSAGVISDLNIAKGVLEIGPITKTVGQFIDDVGKPSEIIQKIQDSYYYQDFSYAINSSVSISDWRDPIIKNVHPASFKVFGQLNLSDNAYIPNRETDFTLTKSVELSREAIVPNIQNFALVEPIYQEFNNTEVLFRQKRLTSSEQILTSVVQRLDDISSLFDGQRISFPLTVGGNTVVANENQLMVILNGVAQTPGTSFSIQGDSIVFSEPPSPPAQVQYVVATIEQIEIKRLTFTNISGIFPLVGNTLNGTTSSARLSVTAVEGNDIFGFVTEGQFLPGEFVVVNTTGFAANLNTITDVENIGLYIFGETVTNFNNEIAKVEEINLAKGAEIPIAKLRYSIGSATTSIEVVQNDEDGGSLPVGTFVIDERYQFGSEIFVVNTVNNTADSTILGVTRAQLGTAPAGLQENTPIYGTQIEVTDTLILSKITGTYQSTPGLFGLEIGDIIIAAGSKVVSRITGLTVYKDPVTDEFIPSVTISEGSSFFGFLFNRISATNFPNAIIDDISKSVVSIVDYEDNQTPFNARFPANEFISNNVIITDNVNGTFEDGEYIRNTEIEYGSTSADFIAGETVEVRKLALKNVEGEGFFNVGQIIRSETSKAEVISYNQPRGILYLGKTGRSTGTGADYHNPVFNGGSELDTAQKKFGESSLLLDGVDGYISLASSTEFGFGTGDFTIEAQVRLVDLVGNQQIFDLRNGAVGDIASTVYVSNGGQIRYYTNSADRISGSTLLSGQWYHVALSRESGLTKLFVNGSQVGTTYTDSNNYGTTKPLTIGSRYDGGNVFGGHIDEFRVSTTARYTTNFTAPTGVFQGDANTKLLLHFDGVDGQQYVEEWSGVATWTNGDQFANDSILATTRENIGDTPSGFVGKSFRYLDAANLLLANKDFIANELVYQLENSSPYAPFSVPTGSQSCIDDVVDVVEQLASDLRNGSNSYMWDAAAIYVDRTQNPVQLNFIETEIDETLWVYNELITFAQNVINNQTITITGDHGLTQTFNNALTDSNDDSNPAYTSNDCADVKTTIDNLITILVDTIDQANQPTPVDHLASITKVTPEYEYLGAYVDSYYTIPFVSDQVDSTNNIITTTRIDTEDRNRFYDAANLIRLNRAAIVDKAAYDLLDLYPELYLTIPGNEDGDGSGTARCKTDLGLILDAVADDIQYGGNFNTVTAIKFYLTNTGEIQFIRLQLLQSLYAHTRLGYYAKQAITGDLTDDNTTFPIVKDWGITNDPGNCQNVQDAIDTLIQLANDILAPTGNRFIDASNLLYFNKAYIAAEAVGILDNDYSYTLGGTDYTAFTYPSGGRDRCQVDIRIIIDSIITDLLTGGNSNTVAAAEYYVTANGGITFVEDQLTATLYAFEKVKFLGTKAINNLLYTQGDSVSGDQYAAEYATQTAYRDFTITDSNGDSQYTNADCANVISAYENLWNTLIDTLSPSGDIGIYSSRLALFNKNYYKEEIASTITEQFGSNTWTTNYAEFIEDVADDIIHDIVLTDTSNDNTISATPITLLREGVIGEIVFTSGSGYQSAPTISIDPPAAGGIQATAEAILTNGGILTSFTINSAGSGYTYAPEVTFSGTDIGQNLGGSTSISGGAVTAVRFDGRVVDFRSANSIDFTLAPGCAFRSNGTGSGSTGGFNAGKSYVLFGAGAGTASVTVNQTFNTKAYDTLRVYAIAGSSGNGGESPDLSENLELWYSTNGGSTWIFHDVIIYGGTSTGFSGINGQNQNRTNFATLNYVDIPLVTGAKVASVQFKVQRTIGTAGSTIDNYGLYRIGLIDDSEVFPLDTALDFIPTENETSVSIVDAAATINTTVAVESINITNRGKGYDTANPPTVAFSGGNPTVAATITSVSVVLDTNRFVSGETITSSGGGSATVLLDSGDTLYVGPITGNAFADDDVLTQGSITSTIPTNGVGTTFDWYENVANIQTLQTARSLSSLVETETFSTNLFTSPEFKNGFWINSNLFWSNNYDVAPDNTVTSIRFYPSTVNSGHLVYRDYTLSAYETYDSTTTRFDSTSYTLDNGPVSNDSTQRYTISYFVKADGYSKLRFEYRLNGSSTIALIMNVDLSTGTIEQFFTNSAFQNVVYGLTPYGNGWYRIYITASIGYGNNYIRSMVRFRNNSGALNFAGNNSDGIEFWGSKINVGDLDGYEAVSGVKLYSILEYNIKKYALELLEDYMSFAVIGNLPSPATNSGFLAYTNPTWASYFDPYSIIRIINNNISIIQNQLLDSEYYTNIDVTSGIVIPSKSYGQRDIPVAIGGGIFSSDTLFGLASGNTAETRSIFTNEALIAKSYQRLRIDGDITDGPFTMNEIVTKQGDNTVSGIVYGFYEDENNFKYLDVEFTGTNPWSIADTVVGSENNTICQIDNIENRIHIIDLIGEFSETKIFEGYTSNATATVDTFLRNEAAVLDNTGGKLEVDTDSLVGSFERTAVVYPERTRLYLDVVRISGVVDVSVGDRIVSDGHVRFGVTVNSSLNEFAVGGYIYKLTNGVRDNTNYAVITELDLNSGYIYAYEVEGGISNGDTFVYFGLQTFVIGQAVVNTKVTYPSSGSALVENISEIGNQTRLYLSDIIGTISARDAITSSNQYKAAIISRVDVKARVLRFAKGFDGVETTFPLTTNNGDQYFPDSEGHMLIFINGVLQPPGASNAFTAFSDKIQFSEPPSTGSSFTGFYVGKLRQLDDISSEFDSLRQSFNLKRNGVFYSLTLTEGVQSSTIRPENNIIVSVNGVIQEPGVGFEIVGSRIIFSEIPRVGSTFVAFSYVGSEADVDAAEVVPPIEVGDFIDIDGETTDREVAVVESSSSLVTFDYLGSIFGKGAVASANILNGYINTVSVTAGGSGYTSRPTVRIDSISGFDAQIKALVGIGGISVSSAGSGYNLPDVEVETVVEDDWVAPNIDDYGPEVFI